MQVCAINILWPRWKSYFYNNKDRRRNDATWCCWEPTYFCFKICILTLTNMTFDPDPRDLWPWHLYIINVHANKCVFGHIKKLTSALAWRQTDRQTDSDAQEPTMHEHRWAQKELDGYFFNVLKVNRSWQDWCFDNIDTHQSYQSDRKPQGLTEIGPLVHVPWYKYPWRYTYKCQYFQKDITWIIGIRTS